MPRTLQVFEHRKLHVAQTGDGLSPKEFESLVRFNDHHGGCYFDVGYKHIKARHYVGYLQVGELSIEILPKADREGSASHDFWSTGLLEMLRVALGLQLRPLPDASQQVKRSQFPDLLAQAFLVELEPLLREGLAKGYRTTESNGFVFRGKLRMAEHIRDNAARGERFFVEYQTFDHDILVNQILAAALEVLSRSALSSSVACAVEASLAKLPELRWNSKVLTAFERIRLTRATHRYSNALTYARLILAQQGPELRAGQERVFALLFDMNMLWERFIAVLLRRVAHAGLRVCTQERYVFWEPQRHNWRKVRPDIVVRAQGGDGDGQPLLVADTKWKVPSRGLPSDEDLKQMFVYNELLGGTRSVLLYPATSTSAAASGRFATKSHGCEQWHVGVGESGKWSTKAIRDRLGHLLANSCG
jgi:5-methylcytosine-specific restriction enzyme subunit McrC